ncbi:MULTISPECIES: peptidoglycan bridge formation glycyltransferase FemA/FemB family protein [unclassified Actinobaculum]|uniref:peptidoglycan bridge formation glycyltransferase FemA/FemB family protein n=1 Tax=unclassified Actinobaculum TaxID=2609299 RepID=UPI000D527EE2|nr:MULTISPECIES: peptidoglycan bridge formation glycyltransferase FemA/FemB family protein [unclassified Actinobaculum]AWE41553.1 FemAB family protein [Actinobaculum sp. 313]RTE48013.1 peptidoglycan bridge formation glycyltransferase FemA/FemB family protein [Actinobaculum sp. 352]
MRFVRLSESAYTAFAQSQDRFFYTQLPSYAAVRRAEGYDVEFVGLVDDGATGREQVVAAAAVLLQPWKRLFRRATIAYGPHLDWSDAELVATFFAQLKLFLAKDRRIVSLRFNPLLSRRFYEDITPTEDNPQAFVFDQIMGALGASRVEREFYDSSDIQMRYVYVKDLGSMSFPDAMASCGQVVRTGFNRKGTNGVEVRFLTPEEFPDFEQIMNYTAEHTAMHNISINAFSFYRDLLEQLGPENCMLPAAYLNCDKALELITAERQDILPKVAELQEREAQAEAEGRNLGKKQRNTLKEYRTRLELLDRREEETRAIQEHDGNEVLLAAGFFIHSPHELVYLLSGSYSQYQSYYGIYLIHRAMFEWAIAHDVRWYNFFGITGDFTEQASDAGVLHFKRQFKGNVEEYVGTYDLPVRPMLSKALGALG